MRSSQALSFLGALCVIFGLGLVSYQLMMSEAGTNSTWSMSGAWRRGWDSNPR